MSRILPVILFISVFTLLYLGLNSYTILRLSTLLKINHSKWIYGLIFLLTISLPLTTVIEKFVPNIFTRILYTIAALWIGIMFLLFSILIIYEIAKLFISINTRIAGFSILGLVIILTIVSVITAFFVRVKYLDLEIKGLEEDLQIVQLSDMHMGTIRNSAYLNGIVERINEIDPDVVVITGDLVDGTAPLHEDMFKSFEKLSARIFLVSGNHEVYEGNDKIYKLFDKSKITVLDNEIVQFDGIQLIGVAFSESRTHLKGQLAELDINKDIPAILLYHPPLEYETAKKAGIDLQLSGHTHAGQIIPFNLIVNLFYPKTNGLYDLDGMHLYVNPGTGTWGPYMRLGSLNEITVFNIKGI
ncbi:metallophosphoesterase [Patescibacteria group bacterium]